VHGASTEVGRHAGCSPHLDSIGPGDLGGETGRVRSCSPGISSDRPSRQPSCRNRSRNPRSPQNGRRRLPELRRVPVRKDRHGPWWRDARGRLTARTRGTQSKIDVNRFADDRLRQPALAGAALPQAVRDEAKRGLAKQLRGRL
jgi:hypothetical protein